MLLRRVLPALVLFTASCFADSAYVTTNGGQFGTINLSTGAFQPIGPGLSEPGDGLITGPNGSLLTLAVSGNLDSINPATGVSTLVGATGLGDCTTPASPCGSNSADNIARFGSKIFATDLANHIFTVNESTGAATLLGPTGIPPIPFKLQATNSDGSFNAVDQSFFVSGGKLFATFDAVTVDPATFLPTPVVPNALYQIDPSTGLATFIAPTTLTLTAAVDVNGTVYAFDAKDSDILTLNLSNGNTSFVAALDPSIGLISGASPTPEPATIAFISVGLVAAGAYGRKRSRLQI